MNLKNVFVLICLLISSLASFPCSSHARYCSQEEVLKCLVLVWGPDVCSLAFDDLAKNELDTNSYDTVTSPICGKLIAETIDKGFTEDDLAFAVTTGILDDLGSTSWESGGFLGALGAIIGIPT